MYTQQIKLGLEMPWYATLPRVEARYYLQYYAGSGDVWIGKTLYRLVNHHIIIHSLYKLPCLYSIQLYQLYVCIHA